MAGKGKRSILIELLGDSSSYAKEAKKADAATAGFDKKVQALGQTIAGAYVAKQVVQFGIAAAKSAGDLAESQSKVKVIFGESADAIDDWAESAATALGMSKQEALDAASTFAVFGKAAGLAGEELTGFSTDLSGLGADLASFFNTSPEDAIMAIGAALRGESEPIRRYGVMLNDATLKARALSMGIYDGVGALTTEQKVLAAQKEILAQTTDAQGDFNRTKDGAANQARILTAQYKDMQAQIGQALLPVMTQLIGIVSSVFSWFTQLNPATQQTIILMGLVAGAVFVGVSAFNALSVALAALGVSAGAAVPWLLAIGAAIAITVAAVESFSGGTDEAKVRADAFYSSVAAGVDVIDLQRLAFLSAAEAAREYSDAAYADADKKLRDTILGNEAYVEIMKELGITLDDLTLMTRGGVEAQERLMAIRRKALEDGRQEIKIGGRVVDINHEVAQGWIRTGTAIKSYNGMGTTVVGTTNDLINVLEHEVDAQYDSTQAAVDRMLVGDAQAAQWLKATGQLTTLTQKEIEFAEKLIDGAAAADLAASETEGLADASDELVTAQAGVIASSEETRSKLDATATAASDLKAAIDAVFAPTMNFEEASRAVNAGIQELTDNFTAVDEKGRKLGTTLDINSERGRENRAVVQDQVNAILDFGVAMVGAGYSQEDAAANVESMTDNLKDQLKMLGLNDDEVNNYIESLGLTPENVRTTIELAEADARKRELEDLIVQLGEIDAGAKAEIQAAIDNGEFDKAQGKINALAADRNIKLKVSISGGGTIDVKPSGSGLKVSAYAAGGNPLAGETALVGEGGPELVTFGHNSTVHPAGETERILSRGESGSGSGAGDINIYINGERVEQIADALSDRSRRQGRDVTVQARVPV